MLAAERDFIADLQSICRLLESWKHGGSVPWEERATSDHDATSFSEDQPIF